MEKFIPTKKHCYKKPNIKPKTEPVSFYIKINAINQIAIADAIKDSVFKGKYKIIKLIATLEYYKEQS